MNSPPDIPLSDATAGATVRVKGLRSRPETSRRLRELGLREGAVIRCVSKSRGGIICEVLNTRIGLNSHIAGAILVSTTE